jgi:small acid-soluble spore protein F (minor alpha/beta-type SASP)
MEKARSSMSSEFKMQVARELGFAERIKGGSFGDVSSRECGLMVRQALLHAQRLIASNAQH